jgi:hypothetical protein
MARRNEDNFGNDGARAYLGMLTARLMATINEVFADSERLDPDEDGESLFMPSLDVLALLCERYDAAPPKPAKIRQWRDAYLERFDAAESIGPSEEFRTDRRRVVENTFRWLNGLAADYWEQG